METGSTTEPARRRSCARKDRTATHVRLPRRPCHRSQLSTRRPFHYQSTTTQSVAGPSDPTRLSSSRRPRCIQPEPVCMPCAACRYSYASRVAPSGYQLRRRPGQAAICADCRVRPGFISHSHSSCILLLHLFVQQTPSPDPQRRPNGKRPGRGRVCSRHQLASAAIELQPPSIYPSPSVEL